MSASPIVIRVDFPRPERADCNQNRHFCSRSADADLPLCARRRSARAANLRAWITLPYLRGVVEWAESDPNVRVVVLEGSVARGDPSVDEWSDLDVRLYVVDAEQLLSDRRWFEQFGEVLVVEALANLGWHPTRLVYYVDGKIDFMIAPTAALERRDRFGRHVRVLVDKDALTVGIAQGEPAHVSLPDETAFLACVNEFYAAALMHARMLVRDEPIKAKFRDWDMKDASVHDDRVGSRRAVRRRP